jgi:hypothetical protein
MIETYIKSGATYCFGRDNCFRPIIYLNAALLSQAMDSNLPAFEKFWITYISHLTQNLLLNGKIESFVIICDWQGQSDFKSPSSFYHKLTEKLQYHTNFISRIYRYYIVNCESSLISGLTSWVSSLWKPENPEKLKICQKRCNPEMLRHISRQQLLCKFGGFVSSLSAKHMWPPGCENYDFFLRSDHTEDRLISTEAYWELYKGGWFESGKEKLNWNIIENFQANINANKNVLEGLG